MARTKNTPTEAEVTETEATTEQGSITVKDLCAELNAEPKAFRRWLRSQSDNRAGKGGRWSFSPEVAEQLKAKYADRAKAKATEPVLKSEAD